MARKQKVIVKDTSQQVQQAIPPQSDPKANLIFLQSEGHLIAGKWRLGAKLGSGSFGEIYVGISTSDNDKVAIKLVCISI